MLPTPRFPPVLDNTMVNSFRNCPTAFYNEHVLGLSGNESIHLIAGKTFAKGCETARRAFYADGHNEVTALTLATRDMIIEYGSIDLRIGADDPSSKLFAKSWERVHDAFLAYFGQLPLPAKCTNAGVHRLGEDPYPPAKLGNKLGVEFSAVLPLGINNPQTNEELLFSLRYDALCDSPMGRLGMDEKTGSALSQDWSDQWQLRSQFLNYIKVTQLLGYDIKGMIIRGAILQKTQFHFPEAIVLPPQSVIDRCWENTLHQIHRMVFSWKNDFWPSDFGEACHHYGLCQFHDICQRAEPSEWYDDFNISYWHPAEAKREWVHRIELEETGEIE